MYLSLRKPHGRKEAMKLSTNKLNTDSKVLGDLRATVKVTRLYAGVPVTSVSKVSRAVHQTNKKVLASNKATMVTDNATVAYELILIGAVG